MTEREILELIEPILETIAELPPEIRHDVLDRMFAEVRYYIDERLKQEKPPPLPPGPKPKPKPPKPGAKKEVLLAVGGHGLMSMVRLSDKRILVGEYTMAARSGVHCVGVGKVDNPETGESVIRITEDNGYVYVAAEGSVHSILRDKIRPNPKDYNFEHFKTLKTGAHKGAYDIARIAGQLIFVGGGEITVNGQAVKSWTDRYYVKKAVAYKGRALVIGYNFDLDRGGWFDSEAWNWINAGNKYWRFISGASSHIHPGFLWIVGTINYRGGKHHANSAAIWQRNRDGGLHLLKVFKGYDYSTAVEVGPDGRIYFLLTRRWKKHIPGAALMELHKGKIREIAKFDESEGRAIAFDGEGDILCATRSHGEGGKVYRISNA